MKDQPGQSNQPIPDLRDPLLRAWGKASNAVAAKVMARLADRGLLVGLPSYDRGDLADEIREIAMEEVEQVRRDLARVEQAVEQHVDQSGKPWWSWS
jgi:hypothetical protein